MAFPYYSFVNEILVVRSLIYFIQTLVDLCGMQKSIHSTAMMDTNFGGSICIYLKCSQLITLAYSIRCIWPYFNHIKCIRVLFPRKHSKSKMFQMSDFFKIHPIHYAESLSMFRKCVFHLCVKHLYK